jgi:hypothetical protein
LDPDENEQGLDLELARLRDRAVEITPNASAPSRAPIIDPESCTGCISGVEARFREC